MTSNAFVRHEGEHAFVEVSAYVKPHDDTATITDENVQSLLDEVAQHLDTLADPNAQVAQSDDDAEALS